MMEKLVNGVLVELTQDEQATRQAQIDAYDAQEPTREALRQIVELEASVTPRRMREALLTQAGADWLAAVEDQIALERAKL